MIDIRIHVLTTYNSPNSLALTYPLLINRDFFIKQRIKIHFYEKINSKLYNCDVLFINSKFFRAWYPKKEKEIYDTLEGFKKRIQKIIWFDTTDSTGTTQFNIMPFVDAYYKSQVLKDKSLYTKSFYGHRIFTDFYKTALGIHDEIESRSLKIDQEKALLVPLQKKYEDKLRLSWNSAMNDWGTYIFLYGGLRAKLRSISPFKTNYTTRFVNADKERKVDISGRIGLSHSQDTIRYQRENAVKILKKFNVDSSKISRREYLNEMRNSKISISPFGWGEVCYRDFEIIINGALLFKQDMSHLETWPPLYVDGETYVPFSWDLKDFEEKLGNILNDSGKIRAISKKAQETYAYYLYGGGRSEFCDKVLRIIK